MEVSVLAYYDPQLPIQLAGDASSCGIGAVLSHVLPDGSEKPVLYALPRALLQNKWPYVQLEKEALSLVYGIQKFHQYIYGRNFTLLIDHHPLTVILGPKKGIPPLAAARLLRWALLLLAYQYTNKFHPTQDHANADGLSRLPVKGAQPIGNFPQAEVFNATQMQVLHVTVDQL